MSLADHFRELRNRVVIASLGVLVLSVVGWYVYADLIGLLIQPLKDVRDASGREIVNINFGASITQPFSVQLKVAIFVGIVLSSPIWIWQIWGFLMPGLTKKERRIALAYFCAAVPLFLAGAALAAWAIPRTVAILLSFTPEGAANLQDAMTYLNFVLYFILAFGLAFLMPVALVGLNQLKILSARVMIKGWRVALMIILVFAAFVTPDPSAWTMIALSIPVYILYWGAIGVSVVMERRRAKKDPTTAWKDLSPDEASPL
ncbi:twin-arginine translocase subunit TatC [Ornithinimicrobium cryptoxanthini]|uniref:twin-arginine translocase subunit TatC n=1 Tax=Ornithinimicrobium cryptoxanthini TaxID=2934161 RepID=UPI002117D40E|nr:twin-arginine translocase subunit TatC [Ornithinimicrobium cryptoxanthini]